MSFVFGREENVLWNINNIYYRIIKVMFLGNILFFMVDFNYIGVVYSVIEIS